MKTIDMTPTWEAVVHLCRGCIENPEAPAKVKQDCWNELYRLARWVDKYKRWRDKNKKKGV